MARIAGEWLRRSGVEYTSASITSQMTHWLLQIGSSPDLVRAGLAIVDDELAHAELALEVARAAGAAGGPTIVRERLELARRPGLPLEADVLRYALGPFVIGETLAVRVFGAMRAGAAAASARAALDRILVDEVRHRDFAWTLLEWLVIASPGAAALAAGCAAEARAILGAYGEREAIAGAPAIGPLGRAWGLLEADEARRIFAECVDRDLRPRFARLGVDIGV